MSCLASLKQCFFITYLITIKLSDFYKKNYSGIKKKLGTQIILLLYQLRMLLYFYLLGRNLFSFSNVTNTEYIFLSSVSGRSQPPASLEPVHPGRGFYIPLSVICNNLYVFFYHLKFYKFHLKLEILLFLRVTFGEQLFDYK